ncbi:uncharacterized protein LOC131628657 [Vicia villosa]|uniref:uncharacterized protein LOC131628657 n=1 Tax=Vicia villosa TaxID=3911 RepID=UPI00273C38BF|nr:uncharacterized protein LOC131628657 [Vicia villosa]
MQTITFSRDKAPCPLDQALSFCRTYRWTEPETSALVALKAKAGIAKGKHTKVVLECWSRGQKFWRFHIRKRCYCNVFSFERRCWDMEGAGYIGDDKAIVETLDLEGWLEIGDVCYFVSDGFLFIIDRLKELVKYKIEEKNLWCCLFRILSSFLSALM